MPKPNFDMRIPDELKYTGEAWLLETLALFRLPVCHMTRTEEAMVDWLNRGYHELTMEGLVATLRSMYERGLINAYCDELSSNPVSLQEFLDGLESTCPKLHCGVTIKGGALWESLAQPDWNRFFESYGWTANTVEITAGSKERLVELISNGELLWQRKMVIAENAIECFSPWMPLAWKSLPVGYRAAVEFAESPPVIRSQQELRSTHREEMIRIIELRQWGTSICGLRLI